MGTDILDVTPEKRVYLSIISEYDIKLSICELVDNAIDLWIKNKRKNVEIKIDLDERQQFISIEDNSGGIPESNLDHIISPGKTSNDISDDVIGYFGVGSKRAVVALAQNIVIHSRYENGKSFTVKFDDDWIENDPDWKLPYAESTVAINPFSTLIELSKLRVHLTVDEIQDLKRHLSEVYAKFIRRGLNIEVNGEKVVAVDFDAEWSYPPDFSPSNFQVEIPREGRTVKVGIISGLINHPGDPDNSYGVFVYCNDRLIVRGLTDYSIGFTSGLIGHPHYNISLVRTIVTINGQSRDMPWDGSKSGIDQKHPIFKSLRPQIIEVTKRYAQVSRSLQGKWDTEVFRYRSGNVTSSELDDVAGTLKDYLPRPAPSKRRWHQKITAINAHVVKEKPWASGSLDSVIATDLIFKQNFAHKNRISLILLDSALEIAYKDYLVNEVGIGATKFKSICENRASVQNEVRNHIDVDERIIKKIEHYYKLRCDLIHQRATPNISDPQVEDYRGIVETILHKMFGLTFSSIDL